MARQPEPIGVDKLRVWVAQVSPFGGNTVPDLVRGSGAIHPHGELVVTGALARKPGPYPYLVDLLGRADAQAYLVRGVGCPLEPYVRPVVGGAIVFLGDGPSGVAEVGHGLGLVPASDHRGEGRRAHYQGEQECPHEGPEALHSSSPFG